MADILGFALRPVNALLQGVNKGLTTAGAADPLAYVLFAVAALIGVWTLLKVFAGFGRFILRTVGVGAPGVRKFGEWAVVTGATDGIGLAAAKEFARRKLNVVLLGRSAEKLENAAKEISAKSPNVRVSTVQADFSSDDAQMWQRIAAKLNGLDIGVLYNNAGVSYPFAMFLNEVDDESIKNLIEVNVNAATQMTRIVLPGMLERKRGAIINVASAAGIFSVGNPLYAVYSASKAYLDFFSRSLHYELARKGVVVQSQIPYYVASKMSKIRKTSIFVPSPSGYAKASLNAIGSGASVVPYWSHALQHFFISLLPDWLVAHLVIKNNLGIRARGMKKKDEDAKTR